LKHFPNTATTQLSRDFNHAERYAQKLQKYRTERLARTETANALSEGELQGYEQMKIKKVKFNADPECCEECADKDGDVYDIKDAHGVITVHPGCECTWTAVT